jgi:hypothetical protein
MLKILYLKGLKCIFITGAWHQAPQAPAKVNLVLSGGIRYRYEKVSDPSSVPVLQVFSTMIPVKVKILQLKSN